MDLVNAISIEYCEPTLSLSSRGGFPGMKALCSIKVVHFSPSDDVRSLEGTFEG